MLAPITLFRSTSPLVATSMAALVTAVWMPDGPCEQNFIQSLPDLAATAPMTVFASALKPPRIDLDVDAAALAGRAIAMATNPTVNMRRRDKGVTGIAILELSGMVYRNGGKSLRKRLRVD